MYLFYSMLVAKVYFVNLNKNAVKKHFSSEQNSERSEQVIYFVLNDTVTQIVDYQN
jgi:hypothetical protein